MALIEEYTNANGDELELHHQEAGDRWHVICWKAGENNSLELHWDVDYIVTGLVDGNPNKQITRPMTEDEARAEFNRWR